MKQIIFVFLAMTIAYTGFAQKGSAVKKAQQKETSDPQALAIVKKVKSKYQSYKTTQMDVKITVKDGSQEESQSAKIFTMGTSDFRLETTEQDIVTDGKTVWTHIKGDYNELQIADYDEEEMGIFGSPGKLLDNYSKDYVIALVGEATEKGKTVYKIECKPKDRYSDITKVRFTIEKTSHKVTRIKVFERSNIHYTLSIVKFSPNVSISSTLFSIDSKKFKKENVTDMRFEE